MSWDPERYRTFSSVRQKPFLDLLARLPERPYRRIADLGCGPGENTAVVAATYPDAEVVGIDSSATMLAAARESHPGVRFEEGDLATWTAPGAYGLLVSNAAFHWLPNHEALLGRLVASLAPGGVLAFQVPANYDAPSHRAVADVASYPRWADRAQAALAPGSVLEGPLYAEILNGLGLEPETWDAVYDDMLDGIPAMFEWLAGTTLHAVWPRLDEDEQEEFAELLCDRLQAAYGDGDRIRYPFQRRFVIAVKPTS